MLEGNREYQIIETSSGTVRGKHFRTMIEEKIYYAFKGIPYAKPPLGDLRFKPPVIPDKWAHTLDAFTFENKAMQIDPATKEIVGSEDCLYLNIFVPANATHENKLPVLVYIHGGFFITGDGNIYGPDLIINQNMILVSFNYRLGVFGFVTLGTTDYSGNMGLKDQRLALRWIRNNIEQFGGDNTNITAFGTCAGAVSVHLHMLSLGSQDLFNRAIMSSGCALCPWAYKNKDQTHLKDLAVLALKLGYPIANYDDATIFLNDIDGKSLMNLTKSEIYMPGFARKSNHFIWLPVIEPTNSKMVFMSRPPSERSIMSKYSSNMDTLFGYTSSEMLSIVSKELHNPELLEPFDRQFEINGPLRENDIIHFGAFGCQDMFKEIRAFYFNNEYSITGNMLRYYVDMMSDVWFKYAIDKAVKIQTKKSTGNTYYYVFDSESELNFMKKNADVAKFNIPGPCHGDDCCHLFPKMNNPNEADFVYAQLENNSREKLLVNNFTQLICNFAKCGVPVNGASADMYAAKPNDCKYMELSSNLISILVNPNSEAVAFWDNILHTYRNTLN